MRTTSSGSRTIRSPLKGEHDHDREQQGDERQRTDARDESSPIPFFTFRSQQNETGKQSCREWRPQIQSDALGKVEDADGNGGSLHPEPYGQDRNEDPNIKTVKDDLEDPVQRHQSRHVIRIASASSFQTRTMAMQRAMPIRISPRMYAGSPRRNRMASRNISTGPISQFCNSDRPSACGRHRPTFRSAPWLAAGTS